MSTHEAFPGTVSRVVRAHPVTAFLVWFFTVGQAFAFAPLVLAARDIQVPVQPFIVASTLVGLLLPALLITRLVDGPDALRVMWRRALDVRVGLGWYAFALVLVPATTLAVAMVLLGAPAAVPPLGTLLLSGVLVPLLWTLLPNNLWEEVAWAGFVQTRLQSRRGPVVAALLTAPLFALQHVALTAGNDLATAAFLMAVLVVLAVPFRLLVGWVLNRTGSLFLVGLVHASGNAVATGSGFQPGLLRRLYPDDVTASMTHLLAFLVLGVAVLLLTRGRLGTTRHHAATSRPTRPAGTVTDRAELGAPAATR